MTEKQMEELFEKHSGEMRDFQKVENKLSRRADLHAFILLDSLCPGDDDVVAASAHDEFWLDFSGETVAEKITEAQVIELHQCGVMFDVYSGFSMFA